MSDSSTRLERTSGVRIADVDSSRTSAGRRAVRRDLRRAASTRPGVGNLTPAWAV
ncbi:hypothetical protein [Skermania piniformis]|uniref:Uncharacterized protein n=1 Tax=Skermania pinensis TaxID=39122 RepID=A0ABX8SAA6_9ACTN|nr:hypothetical protein [Skermania piniformis]QXQ14241.1 hypothetical protein KV203_02050 [Skermania piniformis]